MTRFLRALFRWLSIALVLCFLALALVLARRPQALPLSQTGQAPPMVDTIAQLPPPDSPLPTVIIEGTIFPTSTPLPIPTPWPTPTLRNEPTATAIPIKPPPTSATGYLLYASPNASNKSANEWFNIRTDEVGQAIPESKQRLVEVDDSLGYAQPSPFYKYILFIQPGVAGGVPYIYEIQTKQTWPLFRNEKLFPEYNIEKFDQIIGLPFGWHPDGQQVLFWSATGSYAGLWLVNVETSQRTVIRLIADGPPQGVAISPDGQRIAFAINDGISTHLETAYIDGSSQVMIPGVTVISLFEWSPDGKWILFSGDVPAVTRNESNASDNGSLWLMNAETHEFRPLQIPSITNWPFKATWSPDSRSVAASGLPPNTSFRCADKNLPAIESDTCQYEKVNIYAEDITSGEMRQIATGIRPAWSPDGTSIAFLSMKSGNPELWTVRSDGSDLQQVTNDGQWKWSYLAWISLEGKTK